MTCKNTTVWTQEGHFPSLDFTVEIAVPFGAVKFLPFYFFSLFFPPSHRKTRMICLSPGLSHDIMTYLLNCALRGEEHLQGASIIICENVEKQGIMAGVGE